MSISTHYDRDAMARWYARQHMRTDPGLVSVQYLPENSPEREIRLVEVNEQMPERIDSFLSPIDFGRDAGTDSEHLLVFLDVTPSQWERIRSAEIDLPSDWSLSGAVEFRDE
jgi:hypothetical protein